jgi:Zn-dependent protease
MQINFLFQIFILVFSVIIHEISHGFMALFFGDRTAEYEGRLTLNPIKHIDLFGSIVIPLLLYLANAGFMIGWAKPVPYNPYNLRNRKIAEPLVAFAGPLSNIFVALIFGIIIRILVSAGMIASPLVIIFGFIVIVNIGLAVFNLIPIPPLDGSKILVAFLPVKSRFVFSSFAHKYGLILIIAIVVFLPNFITPIIFWLFSLITGLS